MVSEPPPACGAADLLESFSRVIEIVAFVFVEPADGPVAHARGGMSLRRAWAQRKAWWGRRRTSHPSRQSTGRQVHP
jgi:hypothetical protein